MSPRYGCWFKHPLAFVDCHSCAVERVAARVLRSASHGDALRLSSEHRVSRRRASRDIHGGAAFSALRAVDARAVGAPGAAHLRAPETSLAPQRNPIAPAHLHGVDDTSIHLCLPAERAAGLYSMNHDARAVDGYDASALSHQQETASVRTRATL